MTESTAIQQQQNPAAAKRVLPNSAGVAASPRSSFLPPFFVLLCLIVSGAALIYYSPLHIFSRYEDASFVLSQWGNNELNLAKFFGVQFFFAFLVLSSVSATFFRSSIFAGCGISLSLSYPVWLAYFQSAESLMWWKAISPQEKGVSICLLALAAFFIIRWLALPGLKQGESAFLGGLVMAGIPCVTLGPTLLILFSHHQWLVFLRGLPLINVSLMGPMVGGALVSFSALSFLTFLIPVLSGFIAQLRWGRAPQKDVVGESVFSGFITPDTNVYFSTLLVIFVSKIVISSALLPSMDSVRSLGLSLALVLPIPISMVMFLLMTPLFLLEWLLLFSWNDSLLRQSNNPALSPIERTAVFCIAVACVIQTILVFAAAFESGLEVFYLVSLVLALTMVGQVAHRRSYVVSSPAFGWNFLFQSFWEASLLNGFLLVWLSIGIIGLALGIGLDFVPLISSLSEGSVTKLAEVLTTCPIPFFPSFFLAYAIVLTIFWAGGQTISLCVMYRLFYGKAKLAPEKNQ